MSSAFSLEIVVEDKEISSLKEIIELLLKNNWRINKFGKIVFLPVNDDDMYNWVSKELSIEDFYKILLQKEKNNEIVGIEFIDANSDIGVHLIAKSKNHLTFTFNINRKYLDDNNIIIDYNWYADNILKKIICKYYVRSYSFNYET